MLTRFPYLKKKGDHQFHSPPYIPHSTLQSKTTLTGSLEKIGPSTTLLTMKELLPYFQTNEVSISKLILQRRDIDDQCNLHEEEATGDPPTFLK